MAASRDTSEQDGLRNRKRRQLRQTLSDTAATLFIEKGFEAVRVADVAAACDVSEKTVYNHFPTKESLVMDRLEATSAALRTALSDRTVAPVDAMLAMLDDELRKLAGLLVAGGNAAAIRYRRFGDLIRTTPSLRAYQSEMSDRFVSEVADVLAERDGHTSPNPATLLAAMVLVGLWRVQSDCLRQRTAPGPAGEPSGPELTGRLDIEGLVDQVRDDVSQAAQVARGALRQLEQ